MIRLIYFSTARADIGKKDVATIVEHATAANLDRRVTGALAYNGRNFCQCLEGEERIVRKLMETIANDDRHSGVKVIDEKQIASRYFRDWSMYYVDGLEFAPVMEAMKA